MCDERINFDMADNDAAVDGKDNSEEVKGAKGGRLKKLILALLLGLISLSLGLVAGELEIDFP